MRVALNKHESVTVTLRSKGDPGISRGDVRIQIEAYGKRSPLSVMILSWLWFTKALWIARKANRSPLVYSESIVWFAGSGRK